MTALRASDTRKAGPPLPCFIVAVSIAPLSSRAKRIAREACDLRSRGTCWLPVLPVRQRNSRSLHARNDRLRQSLCLVGMTELLISTIFSV